jgi:hypothetical protein
VSYASSSSEPESTFIVSLEKYESLPSTRDGTILDRKSEVSVVAAERESS